jgi:zinc protease
LVATELAVSVSGSLLPTVDPFVYSLSAAVRPEHTPAEVEAVLDEELARVVDDSVTREEVNKAIKQSKAQFAYSSESVTGHAMWLGFSEIFADHTWAEEYLDNLNAVTIDDVQRVAQTYLRRAIRTVGWYVPKSNA